MILSLCGPRTDAKKRQQGEQPAASGVWVLGMRAGRVVSCVPPAPNDMKLLKPPRCHHRTWAGGRGAGGACGAPPGRIEFEHTWIPEYSWHGAGPPAVSSGRRLTSSLGLLPVKLDQLLRDFVLHTARTQRVRENTRSLRYEVCDILPRGPIKASQSSDSYRRHGGNRVPRTQQVLRPFALGSVCCTCLRL